MIYCPYCLYKNVTSVTVCGNCKSVLPVQTPSRKLLSYMSQSTNSEEDEQVSYTGQPAISSPNLVFQAPASRVNRMFVSPTRLKPHPSEPQVGQVFPPTPDLPFQPSEPQASEMFPPASNPTTVPPSESQPNQMLTPMPDLPFQSAESQISEMFSPAPDLPFPPSTPRPAEAQTGPILPLDKTSARMVIAMRRAFAGYGIPVKHRSFLLPRAGVEASRVLHEIGEILHKRYPSLQSSEENLRERGFQIEERHYFVLRRRVSTIFIYAAPAGDDLYISRSTSVLCSISAGRVIALVLMIIALFFPLYVLPVVSTAMGQDKGMGVLATLGISTILGPLATLIALTSFAALIWYLARSFTYWLREKDFKVYLRSLFLKDFELDDIMLLEHVADAAIRAAVNELGLDAGQITPPQEGYQQDRRVRLL